MAQPSPFEGFATLATFRVTEKLLKLIPLALNPAFQHLQRHRAFVLGGFRHRRLVAVLDPSLVEKLR